MRKKFTIRIYKPAITWFFIALMLRLFCLCFFHYYSIYAGYEGFYPVSSGHDDRLYYMLASQILKGEIPDLPNDYPYVLAVIFLLTGENIFFGKLFNVLSSAATVFVGVLLAKDLFKQESLPSTSLRHPANITGAILSLYPFSIFYSTQLIRDSIIVFLGVLNIFFMLRLMQQKKWIYWVPIIVFTLLLFSIRPYASIIVIGSFILYFLFLSHQNPVKKILITVFAVIPVVAFVPYVAGYGFFGLSYILPLISLENLLAFRQQAYSIGGSSVGISFDLHNPVSFIGSYLYSFLTVLLGPLPWQVKSAVHYLALPEAAFLWILFPLWLKLLFLFLRGRLQYAGFLLLFAMLMLAGIAIFSDNVGANTRLRLLPITVLLIMSSGYIGRAMNRKKSTGNGMINNDVSQSSLHRHSLPSS